MILFHFTLFSPEARVARLMMNNKLDTLSSKPFFIQFALDPFVVHQPPHGYVSVVTTETETETETSHHITSHHIT